jgi:hypothetical protein
LIQRSHAHAGGFRDSRGGEAPRAVAGQNATGRLQNVGYQAFRARLAWARSGALVVADNAAMAPEYIQAVRKPGSGYVSTQCIDDVELSLKL